MTIRRSARAATLLTACLMMGFGLACREAETPMAPETAVAPPPAEAPPEMIALFNGEDLTGWETVGDADWRVEDGLLIGKQGPNNESGDLLSEEEFDDFELVVTYRVVWPANSGIWFRYQSPGQAYQADILEYPDPVAYCGTLYCPGKMFLFTNEDRDLVNLDGWNTMRIRAEGNRVQIWLNDYPIGDVRDDTTATGKVGLQVHDGDQFGEMKIIVRRFLIRPL